MEIKLLLNKKITASDIEKYCSALMLSLTMKTSLKTIEKNYHWHYKKDKLKGVLEITLLPLSNELILSCKKNREAEWMGEVCKSLMSTLKEIKSKSGPKGPLLKV